MAPWTYANGVIREGDLDTVRVDAPYRLSHPDAPVAVLTSGLTASAAEAAAIAFRGRAGARSFGEPTLGIPTFNTRRTMPDGSFLDVMTNVDVDRSGTPYDGPVPIDQAITINWNNIGNDADPVLVAAVRWLENQPLCQSS